MKIERIHSTRFRLTLSAYDLAAMISAVRWVAEGAEGELAPEAKEQLSDFLARYDAESRRLENSARE